ncbi:MAG TPA: DUF6285 domain-containing protein [Alphaproteobacteria bacterium]
MRDRPSGADLLAIARETFVREVLPTLGADRRLTGLMIANAMAIVGRELEVGETPQRRELAALAAFYSEPDGVSDGETIDAALGRLNRRLADDLRRGAFRGDPERQRKAYDILAETARANVAISNPKYLSDPNVASSGPESGRRF